MIAKDYVLLKSHTSVDLCLFSSSNLLLAKQNQNITSLLNIVALAPLNFEWTNHCCLKNCAQLEIFPGKPVTYAKFVMARMQGLSSLGHGLNYHNSLYYYLKIQ